MASSRSVEPPRFLALKSLRRRAVFKLGLELVLVLLVMLVMLPLTDLIGLRYGSRLFEIPEALSSIVAGAVCIAVICAVHRFLSREAHQQENSDQIRDGAEIALLALPAGFPFARLSRLPLAARLLRARLHFHGSALSIAWLKQRRGVPYSELGRADWQHDGVLLRFRDGRKLLLPTGRPPRFVGPSDHYPELRQATVFATLAALRYNQRIAERIAIEIERQRFASVSYRTSAQA